MPTSQDLQHGSFQQEGAGWQDSSGQLRRRSRGKFRSVLVTETEQQEMETEQGGDSAQEESEKTPQQRSQDSVLETLRLEKLFRDREYSIPGTGDNRPFHLVSEVPANGAQ